MSDVVIAERIPRLIRLLGVKFKDGKRAYRMQWGELSFCRGVAIKLCLFDPDDDPRLSLHLHALWTNVYLSLPWKLEPDRNAPLGETMARWGFSTFEGAVHFHWRYWTKVVTAPWYNWVQTSHDVRRADGSWVPFVGSWEEAQPPGETNIYGRPGKEPDGRLIEEYPYRYVLRSGEVQNRTASISVERRRRKLRWLRRLPFARTSYAIEIEFSDEVGERSGSWKGGCIGCAYGLRENETPRECLYRMQEERKF
jgi:hypothetical protein